MTSPRSLESCARLGIKPVELLITSLNQLVKERRDVPFEVVKVMHESYEEERRRLLQMCRAERERIIHNNGDEWPSGQKKLEVVPKKSTRLQNKNINDYEGPVTYADLCFKGRSLSTHKDHDRSTHSSFSLGDLRHSPATEEKLQRITKSINKQMNVTVSEVDRKIAALMLIRHEEEQSRQELSYNGEQDRQEARQKEETEKMELERKRRKRLQMTVKRWHEELEARRFIRHGLEREKTAQLEQEVLLHEDRWRRLKEEVEEQRKEKMKIAHKEAEERKRHQERLLRDKVEEHKKALDLERLVSVEREQRARMNKALQEMKESRRLEEENRQELLRHVIMKQYIAQQEDKEGEQKRTEIEKKMEISCRKHADVVEARLRELKERLTQEEEHIHRAQLRAKLQSTEQLMHKRILFELSQRRIEKATQHASDLNKKKVSVIKERNIQRQMCHRQLRKRIEDEEEALRKLKESYISIKERRRERLRRQKEQIQEEAHRLARASFHLRDRVRQHTCSHGFDHMVKEAEINAAMSHIKLV